MHAHNDGSRLLPIDDAKQGANSRTRHLGQWHVHRGQWRLEVARGRRVAVREERELLWELQAGVPRGSKSRDGCCRAPNCDRGRPGALLEQALHRMEYALVV